MLKSIEITGKTENDAIAAALKQLNLDRDSVSVQVIDRAKTGFLGIGSKPAKVKVTYEAPDEPAPAPVEEAPAPVVEDAPVAPVEAAPVAEPEAQQKPEKKADAPRPAKKSRPKKKKPAPEKAAPGAEEPKAAAPVVEEGPVEDRTERIVEFLTGLMERLDCDAKPVVTINEDNIYQVELVGENLGGLIGRRGETLDAIQQLTNYAVNNNQSRRVRIHIDAENYRAKREESLQRLARKTAGKAIKYRRNMMLEPMNAYERHVIHAALQDYDPSISTYSTGTEPNRRIVVAYRRSK